MSERDLETTPESPGYGNIIKDITESTKELVQGELDLIKAEVRTVLPRIAKHSSQAILFGVLCALSVFPFLAFLVIGLGDLLNGKYWLSSLLVAIAFAAIGAPFAIRSFKKIKEEDIDFTRTKRTMNRGVNVVQEKLKEVVDAAKGAENEYRH
jgi:hypothetical protein